MPGRRPPPDPADHAAHEAVHALAHVRGVKDTSRGGKYHNKRDFVALAGELGLAWPDGQRPHPVIGFSEVTLTEQTVADYADTLAHLGATIRLYRDTFRRLELLGGQAKDMRAERPVKTATASSRPARPASGSRSPAAASRTGRSGSGPSNTLPDQSPAASAARSSNPRTLATSNKVKSYPARRGQAAAWKRNRAWSASQATRSGPSTGGRARSMLGRRLAATTGTPSTTTLPQGTWAPWTATIGTTARPGSGRTTAVWSASNDTACRVGARG
jgi:hypothetical protein